MVCILFNVSNFLPCFRTRCVHLVFVARAAIRLMSVNSSGTFLSAHLVSNSDKKEIFVPCVKDVMRMTITTQRYIQFHYSQFQYSWTLAENKEYTFYGCTETKLKWGDILSLDLSTFDRGRYSSTLVLEVWLTQYISPLGSFSLLQNNLVSMYC